MSYILDALKKSQAERELGQVPTLASAPARLRPQPPRSLPWAPLAALLAAVTLGLVAYDLSRREGGSEVPGGAARVAADVSAPLALPLASQAMPATVPTTSSTATPVPVPPRLAARAAVTRTPEPVSSSASGGRVVVAAAPDVVATLGATRQANSPADRPAEPAASFTASEAQREVPRMTELSDVQRRALPPLELNVHVYAEAPQARFVYINNQQYHQGDTTAEGVVVEQITPIGVILRFASLRFQLQV